jgi:homoserine dehydrogenase
LKRGAQNSEPESASLPAPGAPDATVVLKFGGSVLKREADIAQVVHEVYRWLRAGHRVVAVVSAIEGHTDELLARADTYGDGASDHAKALLLATGELQSAALLGLALGRAGVEAPVLTPQAIGLRTLGEALDAEPVSLDAGRLRAVLARHRVAVVPGFIGVGHGGQVSLLGRGGSDLTALFVAQQLGAACRLVKDVDGLYEWDPARAGARPRRYASVDVEEALTLGGHVVQDKALRFVQAHNQRVEVTALRARHATLVAPGAPRELVPALRPAHGAGAVPLKVALLGCGTVGHAALAQLALMPDRFQVTRVLVRDVARARARGVAPVLITTDPDRAIEGADLVIEALGGVDVPLRCVRAALKSGADVVTANKALLAAHGPGLLALARRAGRRLACSASVGGAAPVLELARALGAFSPVRGVTGVLNGTTNFVLGAVLAGRAFDQAVQDARRAGFAEADASRDLEGHDVADKLVVLAQHALGVRLRAQDVQRQVLTAEGIERLRTGAAPGQRPRYVARLERAGARGWRASVGLELVGLDHELSDVPAEFNRAVIELQDGSRHVVRGRGAGAWPTAQAVVADALDVWELRACAKVETVEVEAKPAGSARAPRRAQTVSA